VELILLAALTGYLLGSIPTAFILVRWQSRIDLRTAGSGNVGALNSFEVTRSRAVGVSVLVLDLLKGVCAVWAVRSFGGEWPLTGMVSALSAVLGHNYPFWLKFKGGRGLATAAGAALVLLWGLVPLWCLVWALAFALLRSVNPASALASIVSPVFVFLWPGDLPGIPDQRMVRWFIVLLMILILSRLIGPVGEFIQEKRAQRRDV
jgi:glycerol-3-phosphate acyltransferase PlsY